MSESMEKHKALETNDSENGFYVSDSRCIGSKKSDISWIASCIVDFRILIVNFDLNIIGVRSLNNITSFFGYKFRLLFPLKYKKYLLDWPRFFIAFEK